MNKHPNVISEHLNTVFINRSDAEAYFRLGLCYKNNGNYSKAVKYLEKAAGLKADYYEAFFELGRCNLLDGVPCCAIKNFIQAIRIKPDNPEAVLQLGISHEMCEEYDLALMIYQKLIQNSPEFVKAYDRKSELLISLEKYQEAALILNELLKINPAYYRAFAGIGICFDKLGNHSRAQRYYRKFLAAEPFPPQADFVKTRLEKLKLQKPEITHLAVV
ncbi:MAG: tetratricopeptide repeat protein [Heliobacteriaceae bacterium]|nr:tetratricopeptide repeat protein [Heliobacteriaceae bacterium]